MTDEKLIKALKCWAGTVVKDEECKECPFGEDCTLEEIINETEKRINELNDRLSKAIECKYKVGDKVYVLYFSGEKTIMEEKIILEVIKEQQSFSFKIGENEFDILNPDSSCMFGSEEECKEYMETLNTSIGW